MEDSPAATSAQPATNSVPSSSLPPLVSRTPSSSLPVMKEGMTVILDVNGEKMTFMTLSSQKVKVGKLVCSTEPLLGSPFGSSFQIQTDDKGRRQLIRRMAPPEHEAPVSEVVEQEEETRDNRSLVDNNQAQTMTAEEIAELKLKGVSGTEIIDALVSNSETFHTKTVFAQEKYKRKKQKKYAPELTARLPTPQLVCDAYFNKSPAKIGHIRSDTLAMLLSASDIQAHSRALIVDECGGLIMATAAHRMQGLGSLCAVSLDSSHPTLGIIKLMNFSAEASSILYGVTLERLLGDQDGQMALGNGSEEPPARGSAQGDAETPAEGDIRADGAAEGTLEQGDKCLELQTSTPMEVEVEVDVVVKEGKQCDGADKKEEEAGVDSYREAEHSSATSAEVSQHTVVAPLLAGNGSLRGPRAEHRGVEGNGVAGESVEGRGRAPEGGERNPKGDLEAYQRKRKRREERGGGGSSASVKPASHEQLRRWKELGFTSLIVAAPSRDPTPLILQLLPLLQPSSSFAVFHTSVHPLGECMRDLRASALAMNICEPWTREYQVLPQRTHPMMQMSATGGYFLHGITVAKDG